jgi:predicted nucleic acid-binding protein
MLATYAEFPWATYVPHQDVVALVNARQLQGRGAGWIDIHLVAAALVENVELWTADPRLAEIAEELGVAYHRRLP